MYEPEEGSLYEFDTSTDTANEPIIRGEHADEANCNNSIAAKTISDEPILSLAVDQIESPDALIDQASETLPMAHTEITHCPRQSSDFVNYLLIRVLFLSHIVSYW